MRPWPRVPESHRLYLGRVHDPLTFEVLDEALACVMRAPRSYTGEDVAEIQGHGGEVNLARLVEAAVRAGARMAEPGEFTRRAFLRGRIDLSAAEAVAEVIAARSERALRVAQAQRSGALARQVEALRGRVVAVLAEVEGRIDFPDEELDFAPAGEVAASVAALGEEVGRLGATYRTGRLLAGGVDVALVGRPNAGKSSLFNALCGEERALVDAAPGTTRDVVEAEIELYGLRARLVDTAGEHEEEIDDGVERRGIELGRRRRARADVQVVVVDGSVGVGPIEERLLEGGGGAARIVAWNKGDLAPAPSGLPSGVPVVITAAVRGAGLEELRQALRLAVGDLGDEGSVAVTTARQKAALDEAATALGGAAMALRAGAAVELCAVDLRVALERLGRVTGAGVSSEVLDAIFARFCIGK